MPKLLLIFVYCFPRQIYSVQYNDIMVITVIGYLLYCRAVHCITFWRESYLLYLRKKI